MNTIRFLFALLFFVPFVPAAAPGKLPSWDPPPAVFAEAEALAAAKSWSLARAAFQAVDTNRLDAAGLAWRRFRIADSTWRDAMSSAQADMGKTELAVRDLEHQIRDVVKAEDKGRLHAEILESLGDRHARKNPNYPNPQQGWTYHQQALDLWAASTDIETARLRYFALIERAAFGENRSPRYAYGQQGHFIPETYIDQGLRIAQTAAQRSLMQYLKFKSMMQRRHTRDAAELIRLLEEALPAAEGSEWEDDLLWEAGRFWENVGRYVSDEKGNWRQVMDYRKALETYQRLRKRFKEGESRWWDDAGSRIDAITQAAVSVTVSDVFTPESLPYLNLNSRNIPTIHVRLYRIHLTRDVEFRNKDDVWDWRGHIDLAGRDVVKEWTVQTEPEQDYDPYHKATALEQPLSPGAYLVVATGKGKESRELLLISDTVMLTKQLGNNKHLVWVADAVSGKPKDGHEVRLFQQRHELNENRWTMVQGRTDDKGLVELTLADVTNNSRQFFAVSANGDGSEQAFCTSWNQRINPPNDGYKFYVVTDRPAYRPGDSLKWKFTARREKDGRYATPSGETLGVILRDQRGGELWKGTVTANEFGSAWGELPLDEKMALGLIQMQFRQGNPRGKHLGQADVCRLEEYKLPEFKVSVQTPMVDGKRKVFRSGEVVEAEIQADYYYGEPVAGAEVEAIVRMRPIRFLWKPVRDFPWYHGDRGEDVYGYHQTQEVQRETLRTDATGKAPIKIPTQNHGRQPMEFTIEARVVDASRREVTGQGAVRVSPRSHQAYLVPDKALHVPGGRITVTVHARDANQTPYDTQGRLTVRRLTWTEVWMDPRGQEISGAGLRRARADSRIWPPLPPPDLPPWRPIRRNYEEEEVFSTELRTGADGDVSASFTAKDAGYYQVYWKSAGDPSDLVEARENFWVAEPGTLFTGYHSGPVKIVVDKETLREGGKAMVMVHCDVPGRTVLLSRETDRVLQYEMIRMDGEAKVLLLDITEDFVPNVFLEVNAISNRRWHQDSVELIVPPEKHFLKVGVGFDQAQYQPGQTGVVTVSTTDLNGQPVASEVSLTALDASVLYIQEDLSMDPRQFFFGEKRQHRVTTRVGFQDKSYVHRPKVPEPIVQPLQEQEIVRRGARWEMGSDVDMDGVTLGAVGMGRGGAREMGIGGGYGVALEKSVSNVDFDSRAYKPAGVTNTEGGSVQSGEENVVVRKDFRDTMAWVPDLKTDAAGIARTNVVFPDSLTTWIAKARAASTASQFGVGETNTVSTLPLVLRMQHPRFLVRGDSATLSANLHNRSEKAQTLSVRLMDSEGLIILSKREQRIALAAGEQERVDWKISTVQAGPITISMKAWGGGLSDGMERTIEVLEHGMTRQLTETAKAVGPQTRLVLDLPKERRAESTVFDVRVAPSLAVTMLDALPYLIDYPYGCVEQTMSRFMPAMMVRKTLRDQGLDVADIDGRLFGGVEKAFVAKTHRPDAKGLGALQDVTEQSLARLYDFQHADGGWGWWKHGDSDDYMSAYVVWGLGLARDAGADVNGNVIQRGQDYLRPRLVEHELAPNMQAWLLHALARSGGKAGPQEMKAMDNAFKQRERMSAYARALLTLAAKTWKHAELKTLADNLANGVRVDDAPDRSVLVHGASTAESSAPKIAWWGKERDFRYWHEGGIESTAFSLMALLETDPNNELVDAAALWLIKNRRGANWNNTKDTAIAVLALNHYLAVRKELGANFGYTVKVNGKVVGSENITPQNILKAPSVFAVPTEALRDGANEILVEHTSTNASLYVSATASFFSLEVPIPASGHEIFVKRQYFRETKIPTLLKGHVTSWAELADGDRVESGDRIEVVVTAEAKNDLDYMVFEDPKPAGLEAVGVRSGEAMSIRQLKELVARARFAGEADPNLASDKTGEERAVHQELRDRHVAVFADKVPQGFWEIRYLLRAETPGHFHALPVRAEAMYIPEIKGNSAEIRMDVGEVGKP